MPSGFGLATIDHAEPFHCSTSVRCAEPKNTYPTAKQSEAVTQSTPSNELWVANPGCGLATTDHALPFQRKLMRNPPLLFVNVPAAKHVVALAHVTSDRELPIDPLGPALAMIDHVVPFQRSISVRIRPLASSVSPTAKQLVALVHATPRSRAFGGPPGFGVKERAQLEPFQRSARVRPVK